MVGRRRPEEHTLSDHAASRRTPLAGARAVVTVDVEPGTVG